MARPKQSRPIEVHRDDGYRREDDDPFAMNMDESQDPLEESGCTRDDSSEEEEVEESVAEDIARFESSFRDITKRYRLINRIGEGTFSTVYKAEDLQYDRYLNDWDFDENQNTKWLSPSRNKQVNTRPKKRARYVAIKKIYVTSSPARILNELNLLHDLRDSEDVCPLITAFRHQDQVIAILPYFQHRDFREYFREMTIMEMRFYFKSLFTALAAVHAHEIVHRDIKPTNFLYNPAQRRGVLVDFGLAEREGTDWQPCLCEADESERQYRRHKSAYYLSLQEQEDERSEKLYPKSDNRPSRRANRAGTRGFRAPEVLFKCTAQTCAIDQWSAGVILLTMLAQRFPFFHSADDIDALLEIATLFGRRRMRETALLHGQVFETNIPSYGEHGHSLEKIILWCTGRNSKDEHGRRTEHTEPDEKEAIKFLEQLLQCDPRERLTADEALEHPFIKNARVNIDEDGDVDLIN